MSIEDRTVTLVDDEALDASCLHLGERRAPHLHTILTTPAQFLPETIRNIAASTNGVAAPPLQNTFL